MAEEGELLEDNKGEFIRTLNEIAKHAEAGTLRGIALTYLDPAGGQVFSASADGDSEGIAMMLGHVTALQHSLVERHRSAMNRGLRPAADEPEGAG